MPTTIELLGTLCFSFAVIHTFLTKYFEHLARIQPVHAGIWHLLGEVEVVFGFWSFIFIVCFIGLEGTQATIRYLEGLNYAEPMFVFVIMVIAASNPILQLVNWVIKHFTQGFARFLPIARGTIFYWVILAFTPLLGSFITEPAAMTLAALLLRDFLFSQNISTRLKYVTLGILFVNVSIGGVLTPYAAPPVLMVAGKWNWDVWFMIHTFGWKAILAVITNTTLAAYFFRSELCQLSLYTHIKREMPLALMGAHLLFLIAVVIFAHHPIVFTGLFLLFLGVTHAYQHYQSRLILREGLLVAFFLAGLVTLGNQQHWWLQDLLAGMDKTLLYFSATTLTAITDNAALTYLGSLVHGIDDAFKYALVAGAVTGGGLTVIANAPNPAGFAILRGSFDENAISPIGLFLAAILPTIIAILAFQWL